MEKLIKPKFKVGDRIKDKYVHKDDCASEWKIIKVNNDTYTVDYCHSISFENQDNYELVPNKFDINTLIPFESKVLVRDVDYHEWEGAIFGRYDGKKFFTIGGMDWTQCIPYKGNEWLFGTNNDCDKYYKTWEEWYILLNPLKEIIFTFYLVLPSV